MGERPLSGMATRTPLRFAVNFSYYGLSLDLSGLGLNVYQTQLLFGAVELPSKLLVYASVRHAGRRLTIAGTLLGSALSFGGRLLVSSGRPGPGAPPIPGGPASWPRNPAQSRSLILSGDSTSSPGSLTARTSSPPEMVSWSTALAVIGKGFSEAAFTTAYLFTSELYPTVLR